MIYFTCGGKHFLFVKSIFIKFYIKVFLTIVIFIKKKFKDSSHFV